jgi:ASPM-SPD-2-Hydin domain-containing protein/thrombospondin type 3 repeat protein
MKSILFFIAILAVLMTTSGKLRAAVPSTPVPYSPGDTSSPGSFITTSIFAWSSVSGATGYGLYLRDLTTNTLVFNSNGAVTSIPAFNLPAGYLAPNHFFRWEASSINADGESAHSAYRYFQTGLPNLVPYQPSNWSDKIVISNLNTSVTASQTDTASLSTTGPIYVYIAGANRGSADVLGTNYADIYLDGVYTQVRLSLPPANLTNYWLVQFSPGPLGAGTHSIRIVNDPTGLVTESNESDNEYIKTFTVSSSGTEPVISGISPNPVLGSNNQQLITINGARFVNKPTLTLSWTNQPNYTVPDAQVTYVSATQLQMAITTELDIDNWTVAVTNPDGQSSGRFGFQVVAAPEITVQQPVNTNIADGGSKSFGNVPAGGNGSLTFYVKNTGVADLTGLTITKGGADASMFSVTNGPVAPVAPGGSTIFTVKFAPTSAGNKSAVIHIAGNVPGSSNPFDITLTGGGTSGYTQITVNGPTILAAGDSATYTATGHLPDGSTQDVSGVCSWLQVGTLPSGVSLAGNRLSARQAVASGLATFMARYTGDLGQISSAPVQVSVGAGWTAFITSASATYVADSNPPQWLLNATGHSEGMLPEPSTWTWKLDGSPVGSPDGFVNNVPATTTKGQHALTLTVTDATGLAKTTPLSRGVAFDMPAANEPPSTHAPDDPQRTNTLYGSDGHTFVFNTARISDGFLLITHGLKDTASSAWLRSMATEIESRLVLDGKPRPNIALYDWAAKADPHAAKNYDPRIISSVFALAPDISKLCSYTYDFENIRPLAVEQSVTLTAWLLCQIRSGNIDPAKPIQLIGHSAGGFVIGEAATLLKEAGYLVDLVTMLDTPDPIDRNFIDEVHPEKAFPNPGRVERYISSLLGLARRDGRIGEQQVDLPKWGNLGYSQLELAFRTWLQPKLGNFYYQWDPFDTHSSAVQPSALYRRSVWPVFFDHRQDVEAGHSSAYQFYTTETIFGHVQDGFWNSPFLQHVQPVDKTGWNGTPPAVSFSTHFATASSRADEASGLSSLSTPSALADFQTFGGVTSIASGYQIAEQSNAGISKQLDLSFGAITLRFKYRFATPGDGDFLAVRIGDSAPLYVGDDNVLTENGFVTAEIPLNDFANSTDTLIFTLISRGSSNAVLQIKDIELIESDDPDGDALLTSQELTMGTNPLLFDTDSDGINDWEEVNTTLTNPLLADSDGDGMSDSAEILAGTAGTDARSLFRATGTTVAANGAVTVTVIWAAKVGKTYRVQRSDSPAFADYTVVGDSLPGAEPTTSFTDSTVSAGAQWMFYRVEVVAP